MGNSIATRLIACAMLLTSLVAPVRAAQGYAFRVLYAFTGGVDGGKPFGNVILHNAAVYGTTQGGGQNQAGTVFKVDVASGVENVLHAFSGPDGAGPLAGLVQDAAGNFFGTAYEGGDRNYGTIFEITAAGDFVVLHSFGGPPLEGIGPAGSLIHDSAGNLYGTTFTGGRSLGWGTVFRMTSGAVYTTGQSFPPAGALPRAGLHAEGGRLYGTTCGGAAHSYGGTVFQVGVAQALYTFAGGADGSQPMGGVIGDGNGNLLGTAMAGGAGNFGVGNGVIFKLNLQTHKQTVLHTFAGPEGSAPTCRLARDSRGNIYGTTMYGGDFGQGTVFMLDPSNNLTVLHSFTGGPDGAQPFAGLLVDAAGHIWGATSAGGMALPPGGNGTVFLMSPVGRNAR